MSDPYKAGLRPHINANKRAATDLMNPMEGFYSGELVASIGAQPLGMAKAAGKVRRVILGLDQAGKDDSAALAVSGEVLINGVSCLTTLPSIGHVSGEASASKSTVTTGDTGVTQAVVNASAAAIAPGDILTFMLTVDRTASPTTEMSNPVMLVEFEPDK